MKDLESLIQKAGNHDARAFEQIYRLTSREIGWYCKRLCGNEFDTQDLLQEVYLTAWVKLPQYAGINFPAWLRSIAHNAFLNRLKKYRLEQLTEQVPDTAPEDELLGPVHIAERRELRRLMLRTIDNALSSVQRTTVLLYYYDELTVGEIAERMECTEGTVKSRLYLARRKLRETLGTSAETLLSGVPCVMPMLRYDAGNAKQIAPVLARWGILAEITGRAALSVKTAVGIGTAVMLTVTGTAVVLNLPEKSPDASVETIRILETQDSTAAFTRIAVSDTNTDTTDHNGTSAVFTTTVSATATQTAPAATTGLSGTIFHTSDTGESTLASTSTATTAVPVTSLTTAATAQNAETPHTGAVDGTAVPQTTTLLITTTLPTTAATGSETTKTETTKDVFTTTALLTTTVLSTTTTPTASYTTEPETTTATTAPKPDAPSIPGFLVDAWEENGENHARITPDASEATTTRLKLYYRLSELPDGYEQPDSSRSDSVEYDTEHTIRTISYPHRSGGNSLIFTQRTHNAVSPLSFGDSFLLDDYDLTSVTVSGYPGWMAVRRDDTESCTLEWDVGEYLFTISAEMTDPESLLTAARNLQIG